MHFLKGVPHSATFTFTLPLSVLKQASGNQHVFFVFLLTFFLDSFKIMNEKNEVNTEYKWEVGNYCFGRSL